MDKLVNKLCNTMTGIKAAVGNISKAIYYSDSFTKIAKRYFIHGSLHAWEISQFLTIKQNGY